MVQSERIDGSDAGDLAAMHDITDVVMNSIHKAFDGQTLNAATLGFTLVLNGVAVLKNAEFDHIKERLKDFIDQIDLNEIAPFDPGQKN